MFYLKNIIEYLDLTLTSQKFVDDQNGLYQEATQDVIKVGLAIEPDQNTDLWVKQNNIDTLFFHRPWKFNQFSNNQNINIIAYHDAFDYHLTLGYNKFLANQLEITDILPIHGKDKSHIGMIGNILPQTEKLFTDKLSSIFKGIESYKKTQNQTFARIATVNAMTEEYLKQAKREAVDLYLTGQMRSNTFEILHELNIAVISIGHKRAEQYGLTLIQTLLKEHFPELETIIYTDNI